MINKTVFAKYPTTAIFIDNDISFLETLQNSLSKKMSYIFTNNPKKALALINNTVPVDEIKKGSFSFFNDEELDVENGVLLECSFLKNLSLLTSNTRFDTLSTIIIDYEMPRINGIEFCKKIKNDCVTIILLTAVADERVAIDAVNNDLVDYYLKKEDNDLMAKLENIIKMSNEKFHRTTTNKLFLDIFSQRNELFFSDGYVNVINSFLSDYKIIEYYMIDRYGSLLMIDSKGACYFLNIKDKNYIENIKQYLTDNYSDLPITNYITYNDVIPFLIFEQDEKRSPDDWDEITYQSSPLNDNSDIRYSFIIDYQLANKYVKDVKFFDQQRKCLFL